MLIPFTNSDGEEVFINALHVRCVAPWTGMLGGKKGCKVWFSYNSSSDAVHIGEDPTVVAAKLNAVMPTVFPAGGLPAALSEDETATDGKHVSGGD